MWPLSTLVYTTLDALKYTSMNANTMSFYTSVYNYTAKSLSTAVCLYNAEMGIVKMKQGAEDQGDEEVQGEEEGKKETGLRYYPALYLSVQCCTVLAAAA